MLPIRVDFYLLASEQPDDLWLLACRLVEKAYHRGHRIFVLCKSQQDAESLDELLWTYKAESFIPHNLQGEGPEPPPPVQIGFDKEPRGFNDILINLSGTVPAFCQRFKRVIELVSALESEKELSRGRYKEYRSKGYALHTHNIEREVI
jgi:DNA polymerase-3 subunit chi